jgi:hypothetical protein
VFVTKVLAVSMSAKIPPARRSIRSSESWRDSESPVAAWSSAAEASGRSKIVDARVEELDRFDQYGGKRVVI